MAIPARGALICALVLVTAISACAPRVATRGNLVEDRRLAEIQVGQSTAQDVVRALGTPTTQSTFEPRTWYYIGQRTETLAFYEPEVTERRVLEISFSPDGRVTELNEFGLEDRREFALVERETRTLGREMGLLEQLFGNLGRFGDSAPTRF